MHTLFDNPPATRAGTIRVPGFLYVKGGMSRDLNKVVDYYHKSLLAVNSSHFLIRLIHSMNVSMNRDYDDYIYAAEDRGYDVAKSMKMTSPISTGDVFYPGEFYGNGIHEIIISVQEQFDPLEAKRRWRELQPIKVLRHPFDDVNMDVPKRKNNTDKEGIAVITVDIPMLMFQYRLWYETEKSVSEDADRTINQFVAMYPLPNMLFTHIDIAIFNRLVATFNDKEVSDFNQQLTKMHITDFNSELDGFITKQLAILKQKKITFDQIMLMTPMIVKNNLFEVMELPEVTKTRQVNWALIIARLPLIKFLLKLNEDSDNQMNRFYLNRIRISLRSIRSDKTLRSQLPRKLYEEIEEGIRTEISTYL